MKSPRPPIFTFDPPPPGAPAVHARRMVREDGERFGRPHGHPDLQLAYFAEPAGRYRLGADEWQTRAGDFVLIPAGMVHAWVPGPAAVRAARGGQAPLGEAWIVDFTASAVDPDRPDAGSLPHLIGSPLLFPFVNTSSARNARGSVPPADRATWLARLRALAEELAHARGSDEPAKTRQQSAPVAANEAARAHLTLLLVDAARLVARKGGARRAAAAAAEQPTLAAVFDVIESRFRGPLSLADVADAVGRSPGYLTTQVRKRTGRTVLQWIVERRMAEARRLLLTTEESVESIARRVGTGDVTHFIRQFRAAHGVTPAAWRRRAR